MNVPMKGDEWFPAFFDRVVSKANLGTGDDEILISWVFAAIKEVLDESLASVDIGDRVEHFVHGKGTVLGVQRMEGVEEFCLDVSFDSGLKTYFDANEFVKIEEDDHSE